MEFNEDEFLMLSGIQHFAFCKRQWALIHIEQQWYENSRTVEGEILHENAHDGYRATRRNGVITSCGMPVFSRSMAVNGVCDIVELIPDENGIELFGREGRYKVCPVEYKHGEPKETEIDLLQLTAQAMCLEEMFCCEISKGAIFYGMTKRRLQVAFDEELRGKVRDCFSQMHDMYKRGYTPKVRRTKSCNACSLRDVCLPGLGSKKPVNEYINSYIEDTEE